MPALPDTVEDWFRRHRFIHTKASSNSFGSDAASTRPSRRRSQIVRGLCLEEIVKALSLHRLQGSPEASVPLATKSHSVSHLKQDLDQPDRVLTVRSESSYSHRLHHGEDQASSGAYQEIVFGSSRHSAESVSGAEAPLHTERAHN